MTKKLEKCRICGNRDLKRILDLGTQSLCGIFPSSREERITTGPVELVKCIGSVDATCGLVQLGHHYDLSEMYGMNYGYRSGLNQSMVRHLNAIVADISKRVGIEKNDLIIDIGSNDSTTLQAYPKHCELVGIDPTGVKFHEYYPPHIKLIPDFFSAALIRQKYGSRKAKVVTSISMFYDLEDPMGFAREVSSVLDANGIWVLEQSYLPTMIGTNSLDTACQEHLEYYALRQLDWIAKNSGLKIIDASINDTNGGSFLVVMAHAASKLPVDSNAIQQLQALEASFGVDNLDTYSTFSIRCEGAVRNLVEFVRQAKNEGKTIYGLGASTKGNVLLQYANITSSHLLGIADVNPDKNGKFTPGTHIPIMPEDVVLGMNPDYLLVLPWHFRKFFVQNPKFSGRKLVFPLPQLEIVTVP